LIGCVAGRHTSLPLTTIAYSIFNSLQVLCCFPPRDPYQPCRSQRPGQTDGVVIVMNSIEQDMMGISKPRKGVDMSISLLISATEDLSKLLLKITRSAKSLRTSAILMSFSASSRGKMHTEDAQGVLDREIGGMGTKYGWGGERQTAQNPRGH
jgi:hypothetical protein